MNCSEVALFMNDSANDAAGDRAALEQHLSRCGACRAAWQAQALLASVALPPMSPDLPLRIADVAHSHVSPRGRRKSRLFLGLAACGTVALAFAAFELSSWNRIEVSPTADTADVERRSGGASSDMDVRRPAASSSFTAATAESSDVAVDAPEKRPTPSLDARLVAVIGERPEDEELAATLDDFSIELTEKLVDAGFNVADASAVRGFASSGASPTEIAVGIGAGAFIVLSSVERVEGTMLRLEAFETATEERFAILGGQLSLLQNAAQPLVIDPLKKRAGLNFEVPRQERVANDRATFFDVALGIDERVAALRALVDEDALVDDDPLLVQAIVIGSTSEDDYTRSAMWWALKGVHASSLIQPLQNALRTDPSERVRRAAAETLADYRDDPSVVETLEFAAAYDPSEGVRYRAASSALSNVERRQRFLDIRSPEQDRLRMLAPRRMLGPNPGWSAGQTRSEVPLDEAIVNALIVIANESSDLLNRLEAIEMFSVDRSPMVGSALIQLLQSDPDPNIRRDAALRLMSRLDEPVVREALEAARANDPDESVRRMAATTLQEPL